MSPEEVLKKYKNVAVVGISEKPDRYSNIVAKYLMDNGYNIIPVNPSIEEWNGIKSYKDLNSVDKPVDVVDIFRKPEYVTDIVKQAIGKAKVIWMQEGIINEEARDVAEKNGMYVVMDKCMKKELEKLKQK
ncbi:MULTISPECIES: CoA-binding protein [Acidiplasma]|uniref:CoA-binding protein n=2 Tax=Acidiplasma TaxID=507753 RepID=A0A0Q1B6N2_9ARCH|nr:MULTISPECIES: CoA-binding protein [Acidiplasma]KJE49276.1 CoA-binding protein [Acidiplasma sp. MBA-1]KPV46986.1 CoA-binding protein [Acidiplasma aeolicum]KQB34339.1 CoA-binding protein [Acidiplasma aeolicum]KQB35761.1 CoA-binding protein [Acidiplasma cupricumulans]WMT54748.1 MAG: CoA-binding protein [Acidiplasma sp.]